MAIQRNITTIYLNDRGYQRGTVKVGAPILEQNRRLFIGETLYALPDGHAFFQVLTLDIFHARRRIGALL